MIKIRSLDKFFNKGGQNEIHVINDVTLDLPERGMVAIFGKSGCGKTTLLNVIGGLDKFSGGAVTIEGRDIKEDTDVIRNRYIGYIFQNYNLNRGESCFDNVADALRLCGMTDPARIEERVMTALASVDMEKYSKRTPDTLSGGQQQRIAIARAIVKDPHIILADEPTGNLDEANTVMIMDLLKAISKDHLVLLVTHEANLVDYYCDTVIELSDGKVVGVKKNESTEGFFARDKNDIYLGELERSELKSENAEVEYYGDAPDTPIRFRIINNNGALYVQINTPKVQVLDEFSEIRLKEGVFEEKRRERAAGEEIQIAKLPSFEGSHFGRLFSLRSSIKSGYISNFKRNKKGKKTLLACMSLFAAIVVFMSAIFGTAIGKIEEVRDSYNHNVFYVYTPNGDVSKKLNDAVGSGESGVDYLRIMYGIPRGDQTVSLRMGSFESFSVDDYSQGFRTQAVYMDQTLAKDLALVAGKNKDLGNNELLITTKVADALIKNSSLGHISEYDDLIGLISNMFSIDGKSLYVAGVVRSDESAVYLTPMAMAKYVAGSSPAGVYPASEYGIDVSEGEAVYLLYDGNSDVKKGQTVKLYGRDIKVSAIRNSGYSYREFYEEKTGDKLDTVLNQTTDQNYFERIREAHRYVDEYIESYYKMRPDDIYAWLYLEKGIEECKYRFYDGVDGALCYAAEKYESENGKLPTRTQMEKQNNAQKAQDYYNHIEEYIEAYQTEFHNQQSGAIYRNAYFVSDADYIAFSKQIGETDKSALGADYYKEDVYYEKEVSISYSSGADIMYMSYSGYCYTLVHSTDPERTEEWLLGEFSDLTSGHEHIPPILTPNQIFEDQIANQKDGILVSLITMGVMLALMSLCMYFIMRSSLMNRIKEIGIYRAIGVSKKNLRFKFFIEAIVLTALTVFVGYLLTSGFIFACLGISPMVEQIFYYPLWMAGAVLAVLFAISVFFGVLPISMLLRKTPSEILAKYDI